MEREEVIETGKVIEVHCSGNYIDLMWKMCTEEIDSLHVQFFFKF